MKPRRKVFVVVGEASGDLHTSKLIREAKKTEPDLEFYGIGGPKMEAEGFHCIYRAADLGVVGLSELWDGWKFFRKVLHGCTEIIAKDRPDAVLLVDYPDFNLRLARAIKPLARPIVYYISPQVWAWRAGRVKTIKKLIDQMMVIFPFEKGLYTEKQIPVEYVGHPLLDEINEALNGFDRNAFRKKLGLAPQISCVALLPGSRTSEIRHHLPLFRTTVEELLRADSNLRFVVPVAPTLKLESFAAGLSGSTAFSIVKDGETPHNSHPWVRLTHENATRVLAASDAAMVASGTSTLQAALLQIPLVVVYRVSPFSYWAYNTFFRRLPFVGLPNIVLGRGVVPEMIQKQFQPKRVAQEVLSLLQDSSRRTAVLRDLAQLRSVMESAEKAETAQKMEAAQGGASHRAARILLQQLEKDKSCYASA